VIASAARTAHAPSMRRRGLLSPAMVMEQLVFHV
jgi:hypothetical protein